MVDEIEQKDWVAKGYIGELHRSRWIFDCPFCGRELIGFCLNLHGTGKRCKCGSISFASGTTFQRSPWRKSDEKIVSSISDLRITPKVEGIPGGVE